MAIDKRLVVAARSGGGAAIGQLQDADPQPFGAYWNKYGERFWLPQDEYSLFQYKRQGLLLNRPARPAKKPPSPTDPAILATQTDWDGTDPKRGRDAAGTVIPTATYYTPAGTAFSGLADPDSLVKYLAAGMSLDPPKVEATASTPAEARPAPRSHKAKAKETT